MQSLHESYNRKQEEEENEESLVTSEIADAKWQSMLERFLAMQDLGNNYINSSNMVRHYYLVREIVRTQLLQMLLFMQQFWQPDICQF